MIREALAIIFLYSVIRGLRLKVVVSAEILPRDFFQTSGNYYLLLTVAKIQRLQNFAVKNFVNF